MLFSTPIFLLFFLPLLLLGYTALRSTPARNNLLLMASAIFYFWGESNYIFVLIAVVFFSYYGSVYIEKATTKRKKLWWLVFFIALDLSFLIFFKYAIFFTTTVESLSHLNLHANKWKNFALPLGISFFTFQGISYLVDVYRNQVKRAATLKEFALYITLFPHLIAGPIVRFKQLRSRINNRSFGAYGLNRGLRIFTAGFASKVFLANPLGACADKIFSAPIANLDVGQTWLGGLLFSFQIYFDFQGYSLMAIGLAAMFGFKFPHNFNNPYQANGITDFWRRWHISLSTWLRDYIYRPLAGGSKFIIVKILAIIGTFFLSGLWHGSNCNFVIWGMLHGGFRVFELNRHYRAIFTTRLFGKIFTFLLVLVGWVIFRIEDLEKLKLYLHKMFAGHSENEPIAPLMFLYHELLSPDIILTIAIACLLSFSSKISDYMKNIIYSEKEQYLLGQNIFVVVALLLSLTYMSAQTFNAFIYFRF